MILNFLTLPIECILLIIRCTKSGGFYYALKKAKEFLYNPKVVAKVEHRKVSNWYAPYNEEHKRVLKRIPGKKAIAECKRRALILAMGLYFALDGKWTQRNWNVVGFGASGAGKTRFFIIPNGFR